MTSEKRISRLWWWGIFSASLAPFFYLVYQAFWGDLGTDPAKTLVEFLGKNALIMLLVVLTITPLRRIKLGRFVRYRRMLGLFVFFYATLHLLSYLLFLANWSDFIDDLSKRLYILVGALAYLILAALAVTSPKSMVRKLGMKWKRLHRFIYIAIILVMLHFIWQTRADLTVPFLYGAVAIFLLFLRYKEIVKLFRLG